jgi:putative ABC transport system ATP-binding protein
MIRIENLVHSYRGEHHLEFKDWKINSEEKWILSGDSGSGKTTLIHILTGLLRPDFGKIYINSIDLYALSQKKLDQFRGQHIGLIFQRPHLIKSLSIRDNLRIAQTFAGIKEDDRRIMLVMETLGIADKAKNYPHQLSQGQLQRVSIARSVINKPQLLVADEPTSSLDDKNTAIVMDLLKSQSELNNSILIVSTHDNRVKPLLSKYYHLP